MSKWYRPEMMSIVLPLLILAVTTPALLTECVHGFVTTKTPTRIRVTISHDNKQQSSSRARVLPNIQDHQQQEQEHNVSNDQPRTTVTLKNEYINRVETATITTTITEKSANWLRFRGIGRLYSNSRNNRATTIDSTAATPSLVTNTNTNATTTSTAVTISDQDVLQRLQDSIVVVIGIGGVGSWCVEALGRSNIGTIVLIDCDDICVSNSNRQLHTLSNSIGQYKVDIMKQRLLLINPNIIVHCIYDFISIQNVDDIFDTIYSTIKKNHKITAVIDCIDNVREKAAILSYCNNQFIPIVTVGSTAGRKDPTLIRTNDITTACITTGHYQDRLITSLRKELRQHYNFMPGQPFRRKVPKWSIPCIYSEEVVSIPDADNNENENSLLIATSTTTALSTSSFRTCDNGVLGTASYVTGTFGFVAASIIVQGIATNSLPIPCGKLTVSTN